MKEVKKTIRKTIVNGQPPVKIEKWINSLVDYAIRKNGLKK